MKENGLFLFCFAIISFFDCGPVSVRLVDKVPLERSVPVVYYGLSES